MSTTAQVCFGVVFWIALVCLYGAVSRCADKLATIAGVLSDINTRDLVDQQREFHEQEAAAARKERDDKVTPIRPGDGDEGGAA
jgi:hypothetical protein